MQIQVGSVVYQVVQSEECLYFNRQEVLSICEHDRRELLLSPRVTQRLLPQITAEARRRIEQHLAQQQQPSDRLPAVRER